MLKTYLVTPTGVLGSDSFYVMARNRDRAKVAARKLIEKEDWHAPMGWQLYQELETFEDKP